MTYDFSGKDKPQEGPCQTYHRNPDYNPKIDPKDKEFNQCGKPGIRRVDHGLDFGIHCDEDCEELLRDCRKRSW